MMTIGLIALDLDGTLLDSQKNLSERNRRALERCARMGIQIVPTTGRAVDGITREFFKMLHTREVRSLPGVNYAISTNGGTVADLARGISLKRCTLSNAKALEVLGIVKKYRAMYDPYIDGRGISQPAFIEHMEDYGLSPVIQKMVLSTRDVVPNILHYVTDCKKDVEKVNVYLADVKDIEPLRKELSGVEGIVISSSLYNNLEINALGATKGIALMWLAGYLGIAPEATMAFGDGENDLSMLEAAGVGIAMGNGLDIAKNAADQITLTNDEDGVADAIERLIFN